MHDIYGRDFTSKEKEALAHSRLSDYRWRLCNLYRIKDKTGHVIDFEPNWAQLDLLEPHYLNIILKARQLGITTFMSILFLDTCLFNDNVHAAIISDNKDTTKEIFIDKVKFAYDNLPNWVRSLTSAYRDNVNELRFSNGSVFRVGTGLRGGTLQLLHITEFAKICMDNPLKAAEIISGALNTLQAGQFACIESTARGRGGYFYKMCKEAMAKQTDNASLSNLDWKFWFFPWWKHPDYYLDDEDIIITKEFEDYFKSLEAENIYLTYPQKCWYIKKASIQQEYMKREYPSTPDESFESSNEGFYYAYSMTCARKEHRICHLRPDDHALKFAVWDIGINDSTAIWTFQVIGKEVHYLDYYENSGEALAHYKKWIDGLRYPIEKNFMPFDAACRDKATGKSYADFGREMGMKIEVLQRSQNELIDIEDTRAFFPNCWFDQSKCASGISAVENYRKEWNDKLGCYRERPMHDWASHGTKAFMYSVIAVKKMTGSKGLSATQWRDVRKKFV